MSIRVASRVWDSSPYSESALLVHLALADWCDDDGICFPSQAKIAAKSRVSERWVRELMKRMVADGYLEVLSESKRGVSRRYRLTFPGSEFPGTEFPGTENTNDRNSVSPMTGTPASREPSVEPSVETLADAGASGVTTNGNHDTAAFDEFWKAYPKGHQGSKAAAKKNFDKAVAGGADPQAIIAGAKAYARFLASQENPPKTKYPQGWLTERRWEIAYLESAASGRDPFAAWNESSPWG